MAGYLTSVRANDVAPKNPVGGLARQNLDEALRLVDRTCARVGREREVTDVVLDALLLELVLALAHRGDLRERVDNTRDGVVVHVAGEARERLDARNALLLGLG